MVAYAYNELQTLSTVCSITQLLVESGKWESKNFPRESENKVIAKVSLINTPVPAAIIVYLLFVVKYRVPLGARISPNHLS